MGADLDPALEFFRKLKDERRAELSRRNAVEIGDITYCNGLRLTECPETLGSWNASGAGVLIEAYRDGRKVPNFSLLLSPGEMSAMIAFFAETMERALGRWEELREDG